MYHILYIISFCIFVFRQTPNGKRRLPMDATEAETRLLHLNPYSIYIIQQWHICISYTFIYVCIVYNIYIMYYISCNTFYILIYIIYAYITRNMKRQLQAADGRNGGRDAAAAPQPLLHSYISIYLYVYVYIWFIVL